MILCGSKEIRKKLQLSLYKSYNEKKKEINNVQKNQS